MRAYTCAGYYFYFLSICSWSLHDCKVVHGDRTSANVRASDDVFVMHWLMSWTCTVGYLHDRKVVHRDLKPANVFMRDDGCVKLGDLGEGWLRDDPANRSVYNVTSMYVRHQKLVNDFSG